MSRLTLTAIIGLFAAASLLVLNRPMKTAEVKVISKVKHPPISEMSGIVKSRRFKDVWWVHNDSGDSPRLFALNSKGNAIVPPFLESKYWTESPQLKKKKWPGIPIAMSTNIDWEDICADKDKLYIADMGNNGNARRDLGIYVLTEPNPRAVDRSRALKHIPVKYPDQTSFPAKKWHFDSESIFRSDGKFYVLTKHRRAGKIKQLELGTKLYRLDTVDPQKLNTLTLIDQHRKLFAPTAADLSPSGQRLAVLTLTAVWIFEKPKSGDKWLSGRFTKLYLPLEKTKQIEGLCFDDELHLRLVNEQRNLMTLDLTPHFAKAKDSEKKDK
jgi:hypothetical protein